MLKAVHSTEHKLIYPLVLVVFWLLPRESVEQGPALCLISRMTGRPCPGCGLTRALHALIHGRLHEAIEWNWRITIVAPLLVIVYFQQVFNAAKVVHRSL
jgi:hypothetical protein